MNFIVRPRDIVKGHPGIEAGGHHIGGMMLTVQSVQAVLMVTVSTGETPFPVSMEHVDLVHHWGQR